MVRLGPVNKCKCAGSLHLSARVLDYPWGEFRLPTCVSMSIAAYIAGLSLVWLIMVLSLGFALKRCLASSPPADNR